MSYDIDDMDLELLKLSRSSIMILVLQCTILEKSFNKISI